MENRGLPSRIFADLEEPAGDRVNQYFKLNTIRVVLRALQPLPPIDQSLVKCPPGVTPYWFTLFGGEEFVTAEMLQAKLRRPRALTSELRVKYATVAIQGFIHALQLVFVEAVPDVLDAVGDATDPESGGEEVFPVISLKLDKVWDLDAQGEVQVLPIIPANEEGDVVDEGLADCSWPDEVGDPSVEFLLHQLEEGVVFKRDMFVGGFRGLAAPAQPPSRVVKKGKRKCNAKLLPKEMSNGEASSSKKLKMRSQRAKFDSVDPNSKLLAAVSSQIRAGLKESQSAVYANLCIDIKEMELRLQQSFKQNIFSVVAEYLAAKDTVNTVVDALGSGGGRPVSHLNQDPVQPDPLLSDPYAPAKLSSPKDTTPTVQGETGSSSAAASGEKSSGGDTVVQFSEQLPDSATEVDPSSDKFKLLITHMVPTLELSVGEGLVLKDKDVLNIPIIIPPDSPQVCTNVMDSCVLVLRDSLFNNVDPASDPRAEFMRSNFPGSFAVLYAKFKKTSRKELFDFDPEVLAAVIDRSKLNGREWIIDIDFLYFLFNIDKNRWIAVMVNLRNHVLTVFDPNADACRGSRLKPQLDFVCEMFPYFVRKVGLNDMMSSFSLEPLAFHRDTSVVQASVRSNTGILSLLFMEAHAFGGLEKVYKVNESAIRSRAESLAVELYEHCCGELVVE
ncbi:hypothetical protein ARALYDRAFT_901286 [Arabidopsis lyrata subsp. lyrata]|uniref:Ubiquitin-like protease family profile domain-containing protein n=1 Tax=Arabidopsis lyrata subsp. lyrata TaxID=81972 RepID=D7LC29_ARALL|nr:hypothetical protein ARALYDRAFT_901286 [Arabidopsis lyrata subsp. lyrata]